MAQNLKFWIAKVCNFYCSNFEKKKHDAQVVKTCILNNPLFDMKFVAYFGQKSELNLNECRFPY